ncbi:MAG: class I SAM-dependent rRNA methyltransferase [Rickettsiales bacterium]
MTPELSILLKKKTASSVAEGYPWVYASDIEMNSALELAEPGTLAQFCDMRGTYLATGYFNNRVSLAGRILSFQPKETIDTAFFQKRFSSALQKRSAWFDVPYYRLLHSEGDGLPGLVIDRFDDILVVQTTTAGMERLKPIWLEALISCLSPRGIIFRDDGAARKKEGLPQDIHFWGNIPDMPVEVVEHGVRFLADLKKGQKTGWFFDQRANRNMMARYAHGKEVLDLYSHTGGFGLPAACAGAAHVAMADASALAIHLSQQAAQRNDVTARCSWMEDDVFELLPRWVSEKKTFDVVIADPPAFIKEKRMKGSGLKGYEKLARLCAPIVKRGGHFFIASCSHHAAPAEFRRAVEHGMKQAGISFSHLATTGADVDHPAHPLLPENAYLKGLLYHIK